MRHFLLVAVSGALLSCGGQLAAAVQDEIIPEALAQRLRLDPCMGHPGPGQPRPRPIAGGPVLRRPTYKNPDQAAEGDLSEHRFVLYAQSSRATLEAIDAETGQKLWSKMIGQPNHPSLPPGACGDLVAMINGCTLYVMNRYTGDILFQTIVDGAPGGGPALSSVRAYVPMVNGMLLAYRLEPPTNAAKELGKNDPHDADMSDDEKKEAKKKAEEERRENIRIRQDYVPPLACSSTGRALVPPLVTTQNSYEEFVTWVTDRGYLYVGRIDRRSKDCTGNQVPPGHQRDLQQPACLFAALAARQGEKARGRFGRDLRGFGSDGYVYAMLERAGELQWKFPTSDPVIDSPVVIENRVYATTELGGMFCLTAEKGKQVWWAPEILHFVAAGKQRVYAADKLGRLRILDARNGASLDSLPTSAMPIKISNGRDRSDLPGHRRGCYPVLARGGTGQSGRLQRGPQAAAAGRRAAQDAAKVEAQEQRRRCAEGRTMSCPKKPAAKPEPRRTRMTPASAMPIRTRTSPPSRPKAKLPRPRLPRARRRRCRRRRWP